MVASLRGSLLLLGRGGHATDAIDERPPRGEAGSLAAGLREGDTLLQFLLIESQSNGALTVGDFSINIKQLMAARLDSSAMFFLRRTRSTGLTRLRWKPHEISWEGSSAFTPTVPRPIHIFACLALVSGFGKHCPKQRARQVHLISGLS